jgi:hypothetical protein
MPVVEIGRSMKQISEIKKKPSTSSLNVCLEACSIERVVAFPPLFPSWSVNISFKDDVTIILLHVVSFMGRSMDEATKEL